MRTFLLGWLAGTILAYLVARQAIYWKQEQVRLEAYDNGVAFYTCQMPCYDFQFHWKVPGRKVLRPPWPQDPYPPAPPPEEPMQL